MCVTLRAGSWQTHCSRGGHRPSNDLSLLWASHLTHITDATPCNSSRVGRSNCFSPGRQVIRPCQVCSPLRAEKIFEIEIAGFLYDVCVLKSESKIFRQVIKQIAELCHISRGWQGLTAGKISIRIFPLIIKFIIKSFPDYKPLLLYTRCIKGTAWN